MLKGNVERAALALLLGLAHGAVARASAAKELTWIENDYEAARTQARARHVPLLVEVWAPW